MPTPDLETQIDRLGPWFHNLHLPDGTQTRPDHPLGDFPAFKWAALAESLPADLTGWTALDIGCNAGFYSIELARRGARVTGFDVSEHYLEQARWAVERCGVADRVELRQGWIYDLGRGDEQWDLVLFMGVLYHLRYPMLGIDIVSRLARRLLVVQTLTMPQDGEAVTAADLSFDQRRRLLEPGWPRLAFVEHRIANDPSNWWAANPAAVEAMLRSAGMRVVGRPLDEGWLCEPDPASPSAHWHWNTAEYDAAVRGAAASKGETP